LIIGVVVGAVVTLMSEIAQIAHVLIYGIPIDVRLSANAYVKPWVALKVRAFLDIVEKRSRRRSSSRRSERSIASRQVRTRECWFWDNLKGASRAIAVRTDL
jgi:hypothetical protein